MDALTHWLLHAAIVIPGFTLALSVHEWSHALVATYFGDQTAKRRGRLTLNPLKHVDPIGLACLLLFRIGWAKPVPFNPLNFSKPRLHAVVVALAGPLSNFVLAWLSMSVMNTIPLPALVYAVVHACASINVMLGVFNLVPIPPLDGSHLFDALLITTAPEAIFFMKRYGIFILLLCLNVPGFRMMLSSAISSMQSFLYTIAL